MTTHLDLQGADGVHLHAASAGGEGPLMLFLHGFPEFWQAWHRQLSEFALGYRAVALDLRGYNRSGKPKGTANYAPEIIVDDVRHVIRTLSPDRRAILVGHDWGGIVGWILAHENPELLHRLVIINAPHPAIFLRELKQNNSQRLASSYAALFQVPGLAEYALKAFDCAALKKMVFGTSAKPETFDPALRQAYEEAWSRRGALKAELNYYRNFPDFRRMVESQPDWLIDVPTLVLWGEKDIALRSSNLMGLEEYVPNLTVKRHPTATHWIVHEEPEWVNGAIREFATAA